MKNLLFIFLLFTTISSCAQNDYNVKINGQNISIGLDKEYNITIDGKNINFIVSLKDTLKYDDDLYSFLYSKDYKISKTSIDSGIEQISILTAEGNGMMIQKYTNFNPTQLNLIMLKEITKESISYGFTEERKDYSRKLISGQNININQAVLKYKDEANIYEVASIGKKDEGILIVTIQLDNNKTSQGKKIIELLWNTLIYK